MYSIFPPSGEPLAEIAVALGLLCLTFGMLLGGPLLATVRAPTPDWDEGAGESSQPTRRRR